MGAGLGFLSARPPGNQGTRQGWPVAGQGGGDVQALLGHPWSPAPAPLMEKSEWVVVAGALYRVGFRPMGPTTGLVGVMASVGPRAKSYT